MTSSNYIKKNLVYGVGINDADYAVKPEANGSNTVCRYYITWKSMITRCYSKSFQLKNKTYVGCSVSDEWLSFMAFKKWMENQDWIGNHLDKDLLVEGNKIYSKETCVFVSRLVNQIITRNKLPRKNMPQGVSYNKERDKYVAQIVTYGKYRNIGRFSTLIDAQNAYRKKKREYIYEVANNQHDERVKKALIKHAESTYPHK